MAAAHKEALPLEARAPPGLVAPMVKNQPAVQETWVRSPGRENPLEKGMAAHSRILAWRIPRTEKPNGLYIVQAVQKSPP